jgi:hypothetical protein
MSKPQVQRSHRLSLLLLPHRMSDSASRFKRTEIYGIVCGFSHADKSAPQHLHLIASALTVNRWLLAAQRCPTESSGITGSQLWKPVFGPDGQLIASLTPTSSALRSCASHCSYIFSPLTE